MKNYGIRINIEGEYYRFGTDRLTFDETIGGTTFKAEYLPLITEFSPPTMSIEFDSASPVPTVKGKLWDAVRQFMGEFNEVDYEAAEVTVFFLEGKSEVTGSFKGYMTDVEFEEGQVGFTIRMHEDAESDTQMSRFTPRTFQYFQMWNPVSADIALSLEVNNDCPWVVASGNPQARVLQGTVTAADLNGETLVDDQGILPPSFFIYPPSPFAEPYSHNPNAVIKNTKDGSQAIWGGQATSDENQIAHEPLSGGTDNQWEVDDTYEVHWVVDDDFDTEEAAVSYASCTIKRVLRDSAGGVTGLLLSKSHPETEDYIGNAYEGPAANTFKEWEHVPVSNGPDRLEWTTSELFDPNGGYVYIGSPNDPNYRKIPYAEIQEGTGYRNLVMSFVGVGHEIYPDDEVAIEAIGRDAGIVRPAPRMSRYYRDIVYIETNGYFPFDPDGDAASKSGFIDLGETVRTLTSDGEEVEVRAIHRFRLIDEDEVGVQIGVDQGGVIGLEIQNSHLVPDPYHIERHEVQHDIPRGVEPGQSVKFVSAEWVVGHIEFEVDNMSGDGSFFGTTEQGPEQFKDRLRGTRFDLMKPMSELLSNSALSTDEDFQEQNQALLDSASGKFGVATGSELYQDTSGRWRERVFFYTPDSYGNLIETLRKEDPDADENPNEYQSKRDDREEGFINYLSFGHVPEGVSPDNQYGGEAAKQFFESKYYRVIKDPVPENANDLGEYFPIAYGHLKKVPMVQVISKKAMSNDRSAGDDLYIYAANKCDVHSGADIEVWMGDEENAPSDEESRANKHLIKNPFPKVLWNHYTTELDPNAATDLQSTSIKRVGKILNPYHKAVTATTRQGEQLYGVKLRGDEWNPLLDSLDRRFPIRHGVGSTPLFASFSGQVDNTGKRIERGEVLTHPLDIIDHFVTVYGEYPFGERLIDRDNIKRIKSHIPHYQAAVYINEPTRAPTLIENVCRQFGIFYYMKNGKLQFGVLDVKELPDYSSPLMHNLNLGNKVSEESVGYKDLYNKIVVKYNKNWISDEYDSEVVLDAANNEHCMRADKAKGQTKELTVEAPYVYQPAVAAEVAQRYAKINASRKIIYNCTARYMRDIELNPGKFVPMSYPPYDIVEEPVMVKSVKEGRFNMQLQVVRFPNIFEPSGEPEIVPSAPDTCTPFVEP